MSHKANPRSRIEALEREAQTLRDYLFAIVKAQGRIRVPMKALESLGPHDAVTPRQDGDDVVFEYSRVVGDAGHVVMHEPEVG